MHILIGIIWLFLSATAAAADAVPLFSPQAGSPPATTGMTSPPAFANRYRQATSNPRALTDPANLEINLFADLGYLAQRRQAQFNERGALIWVGEVSRRKAKSRQFPAQGSAVLIIHAGKVTGTVRVDGKLFSIRPTRDGLHQIAELNESRFPPEHPDDYDKLAGQATAGQTAHAYSGNS